MAFAFGSLTKVFPPRNPTYSYNRVKRIESFSKRISTETSPPVIAPPNSIRRTKLSYSGAFASKTNLFPASHLGYVPSSRGYSTVAKEEIILEQENLSGGSAYTLNVPLPSQGKCVFVLDGDKTVKEFAEDLKAEDSKVSSVEIKTASGSRVASGTRFRFIPTSDLTLSINNSAYKITRKAPTVRTPSFAPLSAVGRSVAPQPTSLLKEGYSLPRQTEVTTTTVDPVTTVVESTTHELTSDEAEDLARLKEEIKPLLLQKMALDRKAERFANGVIYSGLGYLVAQWLVMARLTWWEFNWDIMEPVTYFVTFGTVVIGYTYFALIKREYTFQDLREALIVNRQAKYYFRNNFDVDTYFELENRIKKYDPQAVEDLEYYLEYHVEPESSTPAPPKSDPTTPQNPPKIVANPS